MRRQNFVIRAIRPAFLVMTHMLLALMLMSAPPAQAARFVPARPEGNREVMLLQATESTSTTVVSNPNLSVIGQSVTFTATVTPSSGTGMPTGTVEFLENGNSLGTAPLAGGVATFIMSFATAGSHFIAATYSGDTTFTTSTGFTNQAVTLLPTTTTLVSGANPAVFGQSVTFTATVTATNGGGTPTGSVAFSSGVGFPQSAPLDSNGIAVITLSFPNFSGQLSVRATYSGDTQFGSSFSDPLSQLIDRASTSMMLTSSINPSAAGQSVTFTATVTTNPPGSGIPTGLVSFSIDNNSQPDVFLDGNGVATLTISSLVPGDHNIYAYYSGNAHFNFSAASLTQVVSSTDTPTPTTTNTPTDTPTEPPTATFTPTEASHIQQDIQHIIDTLMSLNIQHGIQNSLNAKLQAALSAVNAPHGRDAHTAINNLRAFINEVQAQQGKKIAVTDANTLIALANDVITRLSS